MSGNMRRGVLLCLALLAMLPSCGLHPPVEAAAPAGREGSGGIAITVEHLSSPAARTIAPGHISVADLRAQYQLRLTGTDGFHSLAERVVSVSADGRGTLAGIPEGEWELTLTAYTVAGNVPVLRGRSSVSVSPLEVTPASFTLAPLLTGDGTVSVRFTLPDTVVRRLDPQASATKTVTVALHYEQTDAEVPGTVQTFAMTAGGTVTYTANGQRVPEGRYSVRLSAPYTVNNALTLFQDETHTLGWQDILYVESNRESSATVSIPDTALGVPGKPYRRDKYSASGSYNGGAGDGPNFLTARAASPWGETLWLDGGVWDGDEGGNNGNEILVASWGDVYDAEYYEIELLLYPYTRTTSPVGSYGKFSGPVTDDAAWEVLKNTPIAYNGQSRTPSYMRYSGAIMDPDYYRTKSYVIKCNLNDDFLSCADKNLARTLFTNTAMTSGKVNASYRVAGNDAFDTYGVWSSTAATRGKVGLEQGCTVIGVLIPAYSPRMSVVYRVRAVNECGHSDWVYWKGGKW